MSGRVNGRLRRYALAVLVLLTAASLRLAGLSQLPPGLYQDEAYNGLDTLDILAGAHPIYFPANNGREPLFIYWQAVGVASLGRTTLALRWPAALAGLLLVPAVYQLGRGLFNRRVGWLAAAISAVSWWPVALSRLGLRAGLLPVLAALSLAAAVRGWRRRSPAWVAAGGALCGLCAYTYLAARLIPAALTAFLIFWYIARSLSASAARGAEKAEMRGELASEPVRPVFRKLFFTRAVWLFSLAAAGVAAPLAVYALAQPGVFFGRVEQVSIFSPAINQGQPVSLFFQNIGATLGMFVWRGDWNARHNLPGRPVFDPLLGAAFVAGLALCLARVARRRPDPAAGLVLIWTGVLLTPTLFSIDTPHYLRASGVLTSLAFFPALAFEAVARRLPGAAGRGLLALALFASLARTASDYFGPYARDPNTALYFQSAVSDLAQTVNRDLQAPGRQVWLDQRLWDSFAAARFLIPERANLRLVQPGGWPAAAGEVELIAWPYADPRALAAGLPRQRLISAQPGALYRGDRETAPYPLFTRYLAGPLLTQPPLAVFADGLALQAVEVRPAAGGLDVDLVWSALRAPGEVDWHVFVHLQNGAEPLGQHDGPPAAGLYPAAWWRAGDQVLDAHHLDGAAPPGASLQIGVYAYPSGERRRLQDGSADYFEFPLK